MVFDVAQRRWLVPLTIGLLVVLCDQLSKRWILQEFGPEPMTRRDHLIGDWFNIVYSRNTGVAFGLLQDMSFILIFVASLICLGAIYVYVTYLPNYKLIVQVGMGMIMGGAIGNIIDRVRLGYVVDFIEVGWWPIFNLADSSISVGATSLAIYLLFIEDDGDAETSDVPDAKDEALLGKLLYQDVHTSEENPPDHSQRTPSS